MARMTEDQALAMGYVQNGKGDWVRPSKARDKRTPRAVRYEQGLQDKVEEFLRLNDIAYIHIHRATRKTGYSVQGQPDIIGLCRGAPFVIELKAKDGKQGRKQQLKMAQWKNNGARADVIDNYEDFLRFMREVMG